MLTSENNIRGTVLAPVGASQTVLRLHIWYIYMTGRKGRVVSPFFLLIHLFSPFLLLSASHTPYMGKELVAWKRAETRRGDSWVSSPTSRKKKKPSLVCEPAHSHGQTDRFNRPNHCLTRLAGKRRAGLASPCAVCVSLNRRTGAHSVRINNRRFCLLPHLNRCEIMCRNRWDANTPG